MYVYTHGEEKERERRQKKKRQEIEQVKHECIDKHSFNVSVACTTLTKCTGCHFMIGYADDVLPV